jgi:protein tyrosine phosphatase (PTP) superfamily phosphohydrolase (DUF442 family)
MKTGVRCVLLSAGIVIVLVAGCGRSAGPDAWSGATPKTAPAKVVVLPPKADTYEVLGELKGLKSYAVKYNDRMYRGGEPTGPDGIATLKQLGIRTIISVTPTDLERKLASEGGMTLVELPFPKTALTGEVLGRYLKALEQNKGPFYVHCHGGTHRGGILMACYRMQLEGWSFEKAAVEYGRLGGDLKADQKMLEAVRTYRP